MVESISSLSDDEEDINVHKFHYTDFTDKESSLES